MFNTPVLFLVFNRPDTTRKVFERIREVQPLFLFIAADGPRSDKEGEAVKCEAVRELILKNVDWKCEVKTLFRPSNLGCGKAVSQAINWFFENVEEGIILEDDCLPNISFFKFCEELLRKYRHVEEIMHISGNNFQFGIIRGDSDYYFSHYTHVWGWATWRRAWEMYDFSMAGYDSFKKKYKNKYLFPFDMMDMVKTGEIDTWDVQWSYTCVNNNGLAILPNVNLVSNLGFSSEATHTKTEVPDYVLKSVTGELIFPLKHPKNIKVNLVADKYSAKHVFDIPGIDRILKRYLKNKFNKVRKRLSLQNLIKNWKFVIIFYLVID
jgi:hypothetical protein